MESERIDDGSAATSHRGIPRDEIEDRATAVFIETLAERYRNGAPMRVDTPLAEFLVASEPLGTPGKRRARHRVAALALLASSIALLGAFGALPAGAQSALARVSDVLGISLPAPAEHAPGPPHGLPTNGGTTPASPRPSTQSDGSASKGGSPPSGASEQGSGDTSPVTPSTGGDTKAMPPGQSSAPGQTMPPGQSTAPGQTMPPGQSTAPGQTMPPGQSTAPGQTSAPGGPTSNGRESQ
jgi:hypothetical protein